MLRDARQYERAQVEVNRLKALVDKGKATDEDRRRYWEGCEELVAYDLCEEGALESKVLKSGGKRKPG
jgi:hypothetical protein